jgi:hypothetical protein
MLAATLTLTCLEPIYTACSTFTTIQLIPLQNKRVFLYCFSTLRTRNCQNANVKGPKVCDYLFDAIEKTSKTDKCWV